MKLTKVVNYLAENGCFIVSWLCYFDHEYDKAALFIGLTIYAHLARKEL